MIEFLFNPWVITIVILSVVIGNIMALKYTAKMKFGQEKKKSDLDKLNELDQQQHQNQHKK